MNGRDSGNLGYMDMLAMSMLSGNREQCGRIIEKAIGEITGKTMSIVNQYDRQDLPLVAAALVITGNAVMNIMDEEGRMLAKDLTNKIECISIDADALRNEIRRHEQEE